MKGVIIFIIALCLVGALPLLGFHSIPKFFSHSVLSAIFVALWIVVVLGGAGFFAVIVSD